MERIPYLLVAAFGLWVIWPIPAGQMPLSADHTVHLSRVAMTADLMAHGRLSGWSDAWFFGTPIGDLYPQLADLWVIAVRALSLWQLDWPAAYALGFGSVFIARGLIACAVGQTLGLGPLVGTVAGLLTLADPGYAREGGWMYTMWFGVWPQALATSLCWLGLSRLWRALDAWREEPAPPGRRRRSVAAAAALLGAALLAHPMAATMLAIATPLVIVCVVGRRRSSWRTDLVVAAIIFVTAAAVATWWWLPMLAHRSYAASYGWLHVSWSKLIDLALDGQWTRRMPHAAGYLAAGGLAYAAIRGRAWLRFVGAFAVLLWLASASDVYWLLRPDRISDGFTHIQYQRFLPAAKPGFFVLAGVCVAVPVHWARQRRGQLAAWLGAAVSASALAWLVPATYAAMIEHDVGKVPLERRAKVDHFERDYQALLAWLEERVAREPRPAPVWFRAGRNVHWLMDATALTGTRVYKSGFTPGDNFVHKPEGDDPALLDRLGVRWIITTGRARAGERPVTRFGPIRVLERSPADDSRITVHGPGRVEEVDVQLERGLIRAELVDAGAHTRVTFPVAGYPRWTLSLNGAEVDWYEVSPLDPENTATAAQRRAGAWRDGKARGDDGSAPLLIEAPVPESGSLELRYGYRSTTDRLGGGISLVALVGLVVLGWPARRRVPAMVAAAERALEQFVAVAASHVRARWIAVTTLAVAVAVGSRWWSAADEEAHRGSGWLARGDASRVRSIYAGPLKTDMRIRPAGLVKRRHRKDATATFERIEVPDQLSGWFALDDDEAQFKSRGTHRFSVAIRVDGAEHPLLDRTVPHRPGRTALRLDTKRWQGQTADIIVRVRSEKRSPRLGFELNLEQRRR
ncbi:MAG: hypothetical protein B7733_26195 [Myxococcales bacterium FL481]|nr:MAG: hypothetical protein B7733_26195 [Myxococcales bacterium FL481]